MSERTITQNMALYRVHHARQIRELRRELRKLRRQAAWLRLYVALTGYNPWREEPTEK